MSPHSSALPWFRAIQYLIFLLNAACLAEKQQIPIVLSLVWTHDLPQWRRARSPLCHGCGCVIDCRFTGSFSTLLVCLCDYSVSQVQKKMLCKLLILEIYTCVRRWPYFYSVFLNYWKQFWNETMLFSKIVYPCFTTSNNQFALHDTIYIANSSWHWGSYGNIWTGPSLRKASVHIIYFWCRTGPYTAIWPEVTWTICYIIIFI
jgi:hypothetical protein